MTIHAFTELHPDFPAYINLTAQPNGTIKVSVRTRGNSGKDYASIIMTELQAEELADSIYKHNYKGEGEIDRATAPAAPTPAASESIDCTAASIELAAMILSDCGYACPSPTTNTLARRIASRVCAHTAAQVAASKPAESDCRRYCQREADEDSKPAAASGEADGSWLWGKLMDWCRQRSVAPASYDDLFAIAGEAHRINAAKPETITLAELWEAAGGNPDVKPDKQLLLAALKGEKQ